MYLIPYYNKIILYIGGMAMEDGGLALGLILIIGAGAVIVIWRAYNQAKAEPKKEIYENLLNELRKDPNNGELRGKVLEAGRDYYSTLRHDHLLTIYDEQAITNDVNSACVNVVNNQTVNRENTVYEDIKLLSELKDEGIITEDEFNEKKKVLLGKIV